MKGFDLLQLSKRLEAIADYVLKCDLIADIGTDHAYIPIYLIKKGIVKNAVASDISIGSIEKARINAEKFNCIDYIDLRCGNGLEVIKPDEKLDCIIITGMGGMLAVDVMKKNISAVKNAERIIIQPQRDIDRVRRFLHETELKIISEKMFKDDKIYNIIVCEQGIDCCYTKYDYLFGKKNIDEKNPVLKEYIGYEMNKMNRILTSFENNTEPNILKRKKQIEEKYKFYEEVFLWL